MMKLIPRLKQTVPENHTLPGRTSPFIVRTHKEYRHPPGEGMFASVREESVSGGSATVTCIILFCLIQQYTVNSDNNSLSTDVLFSQKIVERACENMTAT